MSHVLAPPSLDTGEVTFDDVPAMDEEAIIEVRHEALFGLLRAFDVSIDDRLVGHVGPMTPGRYRVLPGRHALAAKMDWVRTQTISVYVGANDRVVFGCGMDRFHARLWGVTPVMFGVLLGAVGILELAEWVFPPFGEPLKRILFPACIFPCVTVMGVCEVILFSRMLPWSRPGRVFRLHRHPVEAEPGDPR